ncbi:nucleotidyl transferase AbiEii/AbiGii toxin family protein [Cupriavidus agavae]
MDEVRKYGGIEPFWTFGGGTVLMLRYQHRLSFDIDLFVPDPQYLGFVNPRLSEAAERISEDYIEQANYVRLRLPEGEIDIVAAPNLTEHPFEIWEIMGQPVRVETAAEIVAKKLFHRGYSGTARDLFDLAVVIEADPQPLRNVAPFLLRHADAFIDRLKARPALMRDQFGAIRRREFWRSYEECLDMAEAFLNSLR